MAEQVFHAVQIAPQAGTFAAPGASVAAAILFPVSEAVAIELDRASQYPAEDYGRNAKNHAGRGYHGVRGASFDTTAEARYQDLMELLECHYAGGVVPTDTGGVAPYTWVYPLEVGAPTIVPITLESGTEISQDQYEAVGALIDELTIGFDDLDAPGAHPWTADASWLAIDRASAALTGSLSAPTALETMQGHLSIIKYGTTATAFGSLAEEAGVLIGCQIVTRRHLVLRPYGSTADLATGYGFSEKTDGEMVFKVKVSAATKTALHDAWNSSGATLGEKRIRITVDGSGNNVAHFDARIGMTAVPLGERDGERVYEVTGEFVDDSTLDALAQWTIINDVDALGSAG